MEVDVGKPFEVHILQHLMEGNVRIRMKGKILWRENCLLILNVILLPNFTIMSSCLSCCAVGCLDIPAKNDFNTALKICLLCWIASPSGRMVPRSKIAKEPIQPHSMIAMAIYLFSTSLIWEAIWKSDAGIALPVPCPETAADNVDRSLWRGIMIG